MADVARRVRIDLVGEGPGGQVLLDGEDVSGEIRGPAVTNAVPTVAAHAAVRAAILPHQREFARGGGVVAEGRDIGTVVFPEATLKLYVTASPRVRAERRVADIGGDVAEVEASIIERDRKDSTRADSPLRETSDATTVDTSGLGVDEVVAHVLELLP